MPYRLNGGFYLHDYVYKQININNKNIHVVLKNFVKMETIKYDLLAAIFIALIWLLVCTGRRIVQKICYSERKLIHKDLSFEEWLTEVWEKEN